MGKKLSESTRGEKLLRLLSILLFSNAKVSLTELSKDLDCSKQTVLSMIDQLEAFLCGSLYHERVGNKSYYWMEKRSIKMPIDSDGLHWLAVCNNLLSNILPVKIKDKMELTLRKAGVFEEGDNAMFSDFAGYSKGKINYDGFEDVLNIIVTAVECKQICKISYQASRKKELKNYSFAPVMLELHNDTYYIHGWVVMPDEVKIKYAKPLPLLLHRIKNIIPEERYWEKSFSIDKSNFGLIKRDNIKAKIRFIPEVADYIAERKWSDDQLIEEDENGLTLTLTASSYPELLSWVLSFGNKAEAIEPKELRVDIINNTNKMLKQYGK